jgi:uncharacterized membrane protein (DUF2068 family)
MRAARQIAVMEFAKGVLVLLTGAGLIKFVHSDAQRAAEEMVRLFHLNPSSGYPRIFIDLAVSTSDSRLWALAVGALAYAGLRFAEACGLWHGKRWAAWFGLVSGLIYVPWELFEVAERVTGPRVLLLAVNLAVVWVLARNLRDGYRPRTV